VVRFVIAVAAIAVSVWFNERHNLRRGEGYLVCLTLVFSAVAIWWYLVEIPIWNHYLRRTGLSSEKDLWDTDQFPSK